LPAVPGGAGSGPDRQAWLRWPVMKFLQLADNLLVAGCLITAVLRNSMQWVAVTLAVVLASVLALAGWAIVTGNWWLLAIQVPLAAVAVVALVVLARPARAASKP
jgi:hypothetical protein